MPPAHPYAERYPLLSGDELDALAADIKENGQKQRILLRKLPDRTDQMLDGRNRWLACQRAGVEPKTRYYTGPEEKIPARIDSLNLHRRHLSLRQKRAVIAARLKADPAQSNRRVAAQVKADDKTVGKVRRELERRAEIPHVDKATDTKGRSQPTSKATRPRGLRILPYSQPAAPATPVSVEVRADPPPAPPAGPAPAPTPGAITPDAVARIRDYTRVAGEQKLLSEILYHARDTARAGTGDGRAAARERMWEAVGRLVTFCEEEASKEARNG
jgi:hypothetical protein